MEVDIPKSKMKQAEIKTLNSPIMIHPIVILSIANHYTSNKVQKSNLTVLGVLMGSFAPTEVVRIIELLCTDDKVDYDFLGQRFEQFKQVQSELEWVGWYSIGDTINELDHEFFKYVNSHLHGQLEKMLLLKINVENVAVDEHLPIQVYEVRSEIGTGVFRPVNFTVGSDEAEAIGTKHISVNQTADNVNSSMSMMHDYLQPQQRAIVMLRSRYDFLAKYLEAVERGDLPVDHEILREINSVVTAMPMERSADFQDRLQMDQNEISLTTMLSVMAQSLNTLQSLLSKQHCIERDVMKKMSTMRWDVFN